MQIKNPTKKQLNVFVAGLTLILLLFSNKANKTENLFFSANLITAAIILLFIYLFNKEVMVKFYKVWMKVVSVIGMFITALLTIFIFYIIFTPVGILLRILGKDILNLKADPKLKTYWIDRPSKEFNKSDYERQF